MLVYFSKSDEETKNLDNQITYLSNVDVVDSVQLVVFDKE